MIPLQRLLNLNLEFINNAVVFDDGVFAIFDNSGLYREFSVYNHLGYRVLNVKADNDNYNFSYDWVAQNVSFNNGIISNENLYDNPRLYVLDQYDMRGDKIYSVKINSWGKEDTDRLINNKNQRIKNAGYNTTSYNAWMRMPKLAPDDEPVDVAELFKSLKLFKPVNTVCDTIKTHGVYYVTDGFDRFYQLPASRNNIKRRFDELNDFIHQGKYTGMIVNRVLKTYVELMEFIEQSGLKSHEHSGGYVGLQRILQARHDAYIK